MCCMSDGLPIIFSGHSLVKLDQRNLTKEMVARVIERPMRAMVVGDKIHAFRRFGHLYLKVVFARTDKYIVVVTQYWVNKLP